MNTPPHEATKNEVVLIKMVARLLAIVMTVVEHLKPELRREVVALHEKMTGLPP